MSEDLPGLDRSGSPDQSRQVLRLTWTCSIHHKLSPPSTTLLTNARCPPSATLPTGLLSSHLVARHLSPLSLSPGFLFSLFSSYHIGHHCCGTPGFLPNMSSLFEQFAEEVPLGDRPNLLRNCDDKAPLRITDSRVGTFTDDGAFFITSLNVDRIPLPPLGVMREHATELGALVNGCVLSMKHAMDRLRSVNSTEQDSRLDYSELQHQWLELAGVIDFMRIYKLHMDGQADRPPEVVDTIGVFTHIPRVAQDGAQAGLPVWLIRPTAAFTNENILAVMELE
ncbi:hypothetical protein EW146_g8700 [Bondarzewia mesenterica]|uniref:Uncharacterized protein n=1 Tax=Bondarzewia mesenterica TaxID=1095465 RepID=A0A4S4LCR2_9AGAM|nr:hypothetical protein EW146_g8700 [Bondarzewia mesenterica]